MPYMDGPYEAQANLPAPATTKVVAARKVDFTTGRYELDADGNAVGMDPTAQRVILAVAFAAQPEVGVIDDRELEARRARIIAALEPMVDEGAIRDVAAVVEEAGPGRISETVSYHNLATAQDESVTL
jgi:hypothetical protein